MSTKQSLLDPHSFLLRKCPDGHNPCDPYGEIVQQLKSDEKAGKAVKDSKDRATQKLRFYSASDYRCYRYIEYADAFNELPDGPSCGEPAGKGTPGGQMSKYGKCEARLPLRENQLRSK